MTQKTIGEQIWDQAVAAAPLIPCGWPLSELRAEIIAAINQLAADFRADLDATEKHYRRTDDTR